MTEPLLEVRNLCRSFGALRAVDDVSFALERGRIYGFIGPNGAGKTTAMRILATLDVPDSGDAVLEPGVYGVLGTFGSSDVEARSAPVVAEFGP